MERFLRALVFAVAVATTPALAGDADHGKVLYEAYCTQCHGMNGDGGGINVRDMSVQPRNHTDPEEMAARTDDELVKVIKHGGKAIDKSVLMPAWDDNLSDEQVTDLVAYLRRLCCEQ
ncbi:MAG: cytochrome c [Halioglobus sp.]|nr:cytochrome c [Halioglobus sp.]